MHHENSNPRDPPMLLLRISIIIGHRQNGNRKVGLTEGPTKNNPEKSVKDSQKKRLPHFKFVKSPF